MSLLLLRKWLLGRMLFLTALTAVPALAFVGPPLPPPVNLTATVQCPDTLLQWVGFGPITAYQVQVFSNGVTVLDQTVTTNSLRITLPAGSYSFRVKSIADPTLFQDGGFSAPVGFVVGSCQSCLLPRIQLAVASPPVLWPPNGRMVSVAFAGSIASSCPLLNIHYALTDSQGEGQDGDLVAGPDGAFVKKLFLQASRSGSEAMGRQYSFTVQATNAAGVATGGPMVVTVPHDQGR